MTRDGWYILLLLCFTTLLVVCAVQPYYNNYEYALGQLFSIDMANGTPLGAAYLTELSPLFFIGFAQVLAYLYDASAGYI